MSWIKGHEKHKETEHRHVWRVQSYEYRKPVSAEKLEIILSSGETNEVERQALIWGVTIIHYECNSCQAFSVESNLGKHPKVEECQCKPKD